MDPRIPATESRGGQPQSHLMRDTYTLLKSTTNNADIITTSEPQLFFKDEPDPHIKAQFASIPWALKLYQDPTLRSFTGRSRVPPGSGSTREKFNSQTLSKPENIPA